MRRMSCIRRCGLNWVSVMSYSALRCSSRSTRLASKRHDPVMSIMNERLEITFQVAIDGMQELKLIFIDWSNFDGLFHD